MTFTQRLKRSFWFSLLAAPALWLAITDEGQRQTDLFLVGLGGNPEITLQFDQFYPALDEATLKAGLPEVSFTCGEKATAYGDSICHAPIAAFNGNPARYATFFYGEGKLNAVKVAYRRPYGKRIELQFRSRLGQPMQSSAEAGPGVYQWRAGGGLLVMPQGKVPMEQEPAVLWLARMP